MRSGGWWRNSRCGAFNFRMMKKLHVLAIVSFLLIPVVTVAGGLLASFIDPEIAVRTANYERNFWLLNLVKHSFMLGAFLVNVGLWLLTCFLLIKARQQSYWWLPLAALGPFGLIVLAMLSDKAPDDSNLYGQFIRKLNIYLRVAYELCVFVAAWVLAFECIDLKRDLTIAYQAAATGVSKEQIIEEQNASSGMWAFSEGLETLYLVALFYLLWPLCFNLAGRLPGLWSTAGKA